MQEVFWLEKNVIGGRSGPVVRPWDPDELYQGGIRGIVSLAEPVDEGALKAAGLKHLPLYFPMMNLTSAGDIDFFLSFVPQFLEFVDGAARAGEPVLVHCTYGCDRTGAMLGIYLVARHGMGAEEAVAEVKRVRPPAMSAPGYEDAVHAYAKR